MISAEDYFSDKRSKANDDHEENAAELLHRVNMLLADYHQTTGRILPLNPKTGTLVSGNKNGDGGFRLPNSLTGSAKSSHKEAKAVDVYDPLNLLDKWITDNTLRMFDLYREAPASTISWTHLSTRKPGSGMRTFNP